MRWTEASKLGMLIGGGTNLPSEYALRVRTMELRTWRSLVNRCRDRSRSIVIRLQTASLDLSLFPFLRLFVNLFSNENG